MTARVPKKSNSKIKASNPEQKPEKNTLTVMIEDYLKFKGDYRFIESVLNFISEPISIKNGKGEYLVINNAMEKVIGYRRDEVVGKSVLISRLMKFSDEIIKADETVLNTGICSAFETDYQKPDGELLHLTITKHKINLPNKEPGVLTIASDITNTKRYEDIINIQYTIDYIETLNQGLKSTIGNILENIFRLYWIDGAGVYIYDPSFRRLDLIAHAGLSDSFVEQVNSCEDNSTQMKIILKKKTIFLKTCDLPEASKIRNEKEGIIFTAVIPLLNNENNELVGNLNLISKKHEQISEEDKKGIESISRRIVNLILFAQSQEKLKEANLFLEKKVQEKTTELKNKMEEIRLSEEKYKIFQENIPTAIFSTDLNGKIIYGNRATVKIFGFDSLEDGLNYTVFDLYYSKEQRNEILNKLISTGYLPETEVQLLRKNKSTFWGLVRANATFDNQGNPVQFDGVITDITEIKKSRHQIEESNKKITLINQNLEMKIQEALNQKEEQSSLLIQKSKLESLGELAAGIAHEINQPLGVMALTFENLKSKINSNNFDAHYLEIKFLSIEENIKRIRDIIDHVRLFSREQDSFVLDKVNVNKVVSRALSLIGVQLGNHNININLKLEEKIGFTVGSNLKLEQVVLNLLSNSKYALEEKAVYLGEPDFSKEILIKTETTSNRIFLMIEDNGIGIKINHLPYIFDPFFTTKPEGFGTGLGLSIVYGLVKDMRGDILVNSREREYTKFRISFPRFPEND